MVGSVVIALLAAIPLIPVLLLLTLKFILNLVGQSLRAKTEPRRAALYAQSHREQSVYEQKAVAEEGWEKVEKEASTGKTSEQQWDRIVGFFHPFW